MLAPSRIRKKSVVIRGHKTSVSLEDRFFVELKKIARERQLTLNELVAHEDQVRGHGNLSSHLRLLVLDFLRQRLDECEQAARSLKHNEIAPPDRLTTLLNRYEGN